MFRSQSQYKYGKNKKIFVRNTLSLPDKVRVIKAFKNEPNFNNLANSFQCSTHQIKNIIASKDAILAQHNLIVSRIEVAKRDPPKAKSQDQPQENENEKVSLLGRVMFEWYLRAKFYPALNPITYKIIREKIVEAKEVLEMPDFIPTNTWLVNFRNECKKGRDARKQRDNAQKPLDMKSIALDIMLKDGGLKKDNESTSSKNDELEKPILQQPNGSEQDSMSIDEVINLDSSDDENEQNGDNKIIPAQQKTFTLRSSREALKYLKILEEFVMLKDNFRAIGLISQIEAVFKTRGKKA